MKGPGVIHRCRICAGNHKARAHKASAGDGNARSDGMGAVIYCACGCGANLTEMDDQKRSRRFVNGHNKRAWWANVQRLVKRYGLKGEC